MLEENSEKLTINISVVDLGKIDYLVEQGFYGNRTDFSVPPSKCQLHGHEEWLNRGICGENHRCGHCLAFS